MELNGKEIGFEYNVLASIEVASLCPEGKLENIGTLFDSGSYSDTVKATNEFIIALNHGWVALKKAQGEDVEPLTEDELMLVSSGDYIELQTKALEAYNKGNERTVHTKPKSTKGKKTVKEAESN